VTVVRLGCVWDTLLGFALMFPATSTQRQAGLSTRSSLREGTAVDVQVGTLVVRTPRLLCLNELEQSLTQPPRHRNMSLCVLLHVCMQASTPAPPPTSTIFLRGIRATPSPAPTSSDDEEEEVRCMRFRVRFLSAAHTSNVLPSLSASCGSPARLTFTRAARLECNLC
jgi:hypothetical protein